MFSNGLFSRHFLILLGMGAFAGCAILRSDQIPESLHSPGDDPKTLGPRKSPAALQLEVMDFSDRYVDGMWSVIDATLGSDPGKRVAALSWKLRYGSSSMEIAAGADPRTNLLDMAIFITAGEWALDRYWIPEVFGEEGEGLRRHYRDMNRRIWSVVGETLTEEQTQLLRSLVEKWIETNPAQFEVAGVRFRNLEGVNPEDFQNGDPAHGLMASVRRWLGEVNTSLLFGERVLFYAERTPRILNQQTDLTLAQIANDFPITTFQPDLNAVTDYIDALPDRIFAGISEDPAFAEEVLPGVQGALADTQGLVTSSTKLVASATELSASINSTIDRLDALSEKVINDGGPPVDYHATMTQAVAALSSLDSSVAGLNQLLAADEAGGSKVTALVEQLDDQADRLMDRAFERALWLMGIFFSGIAALLILARLLFSRRGNLTPKVSETSGSGS